MSNYTSTGCPVHATLPKDPSRLWEGGNLNFKASQVGWLVSGACTLVAVIASVWLIVKHLQYFYAPHTQRHIVRILLLVPIYAMCSWLSYYFVHQALYFQLVRDCYEAIVIAAFFFLLMAYLSNPPPTPEQPCPAPFESRSERADKLRETVKGMHLDHWMWPLGWVKWRCAGGGKGEGEAFIWLMRICIGQYVIIRPLSTAVAIASEYLGYYCLASWGVGFTHLWTALAITISVTVAMYAVLQLYMPFKKELAPFSPILKFLAVKSVVFLTFWQESALSFAASPLGLIKDKEYWTAHEQVVGISAILSCFEMMLFAFLHVRAFSYLPYRALASPVKALTDSDTLSIDSADTEPMPKNFAAWTAWEDRKKKQLKAKGRLAKMQIKPGQHLKEDGTPILQQTKKLPALLKCLIITDVARELREETAYLARRGKRDFDRRDELEEIMGKSRAKPADSQHKDWSRDGEEEDTGDIDSLDKDLKRLRQGKARGGGQVAADGTLIVPRLSKYGHEEGDSLLHAEEGRAREWQAGRHENMAAQGWWGSLTGRTRKTARPSTFFQMERPTSVDLDPTTSLPPPPRIVSHAPPTSHRPLNAPRRPTAPARPSRLSLPSPLASSDLPPLANMGPLPAPHALGASGSTYVPSQSSRRHSAGPSPSYSPAQPSNFHPAASGIRHPAMSPVKNVTCHQLEDMQSEKSLVVATEESKRSAGLPPGAAEPRSFMFEEY